jgi:hypothetical protein
LSGPGSGNLLQKFLACFILSGSEMLSRDAYVKILLPPFWDKIVLLILGKLHPSSSNSHHVIYCPLPNKVILVSHFSVTVKVVRPNPLCLLAPIRLLLRRSNR